MSNPTSRPPTAPPAATLGSICRDLRQESGITRQQMSAQTGLAETTISRLETGRQLPTPDMVRKLLQSPALAQLPALARAAGVSLGLWDNEVSKP